MEQRLLGPLTVAVYRLQKLNLDYAMGLVYLFRRAAHCTALRAPPQGGPSPLGSFPLLHCLYTGSKTTIRWLDGPAVCAFHSQVATPSASAAESTGAPGGAAEQLQQQQQQPQQAESLEGEGLRSVQEPRKDEVALRFPLLTERRWDDVYCSDLCLQLDRLIFSCATAEEVLRIVSSHRGAFFVKNLVSALKHLAALSIQSRSSTSAGSSSKEQEERNKAAAATAAAAAAAAAAPPLSQLSLKLPAPPTWPQERLSVFHFFSALSGEEAAVERSFSRRIEAESIVRDPRQDLRLHRNVLTFAAAADVVLSLRILNHPHYPLLSALLPALRTVPLPHLPPYLQQQQQQQQQEQQQQEQEEAEAELQQQQELQEHPYDDQQQQQRRRSCNSSRSCRSIREQQSPKIEDNKELLLAAAARYLEDYIDCISPAASLDALLAFSSDVHAPGFLLRKIRQDTAWEKQQQQLFWVLLLQQLLYPPLDYRLPMRCIHESLRAWCVSRGGLSVEFREEVLGVSSVLRALGVLHRTAVSINESPLPVDIVIPAPDGSLSALIVTQECARNTMALCGGSMLLSVHLKSMGVKRVLAISRNKWRRADAEEQKNIILNRLETLEQLRIYELQQEQQQQQQQQQEQREQQQQEQQQQQLQQ
ncbi:LOW QUALITY PROTEIN: uncharacterized protein EMH_0004370 [Eimeria mitis]|uniref:RAP domain-containing protein n=1 Tax=Eimeria mitis TaxID=44415 RepID=U6JXZ8_9EIME|nr:LOW QUALITY PROTEIN: uncharacterized protein EMH_0004370 [Eimeria mitis]CDJ29641.1 hypothetical protein, conserved [Eimeria mitis]